MTRFVISITTLDDRLPYILPVLKKILKLERHNIDALYLCLSNEKIKHKKSLHRISQLQDDIFHIVRCKDCGPITKLVGCLDIETDPDTLILTLDDDVLLKKSIVNIFKKKSRKYPNAALSMSGWCYGSFPNMYSIVIDNQKDCKCDWIQGVHGILYKRSFINKNKLLAFDDEYPLSFKNDDHKVSAYLASKSVDRVSINYNPKQYMLDYSKCSHVNPISGSDGIAKSAEFWNNVRKISKRYHEKGYYCCHYNENPLRSVTFVGLLLLVLAIILLVVLIFFAPLGGDLLAIGVYLFIIVLLYIVIFKWMLISLNIDDK